ncbi:MAG: DNA polymerase III subunit delta [Cyanobacteria bacterium P01_A01_bin.114]
MPTYFFWGADEFRMKKAIADLRDRTLDPAWASFNYDKLPPELSDSIVQALNQAMTPPFGMGKRLVWLTETTLGQRCPDDILQELSRTLPLIPDSTVLLLTSSQKPDGRLKATKLLQKHADVREFATIPPWKTDQISHQVYQVAQEVGLRIEPKAVELLAEAIGADTRRLYNELEKLKVYWHDQTQPLSSDAVTTLVSTSTQNSLQLAAALRDGHIDKALGLVSELIAQNEPALRMVSTLVGQFRTWLWVKVMADAGERDPKAIAQAAEVNNPKRIYFLQKEVRGVSSAQLQAALEKLLTLEFSLKQGAPDLLTLQTKIIEIAYGFKSAA